MTGPRSRRVTADQVRRDYTTLAPVYETRWRAFNNAVRRWVLARWPTHLTAGARVLDLGCGGGAFLSAVERQHPELELFGLDVTRTLLTDARRAVPAARLVEADAETPPFVSNAFDVVCSLNVMHHLNDSTAHISSMAQLCRPGGTVFVSTFAGGHTLSMRAVDLWLRLRNPAWRGMLSQTELRELLTGQRGLVIAEQNELQAGGWWLQLYRLTAVSGASAHPADPPGRARA